MPQKKDPRPLESFVVSATFPITPEEMYAAWMDNKKHGAFTGGKAKIAPKVKGRFTAWDGYISGVTLALEPEKRIVQSWRTTDFSDDEEDSLLELIFEKAKEGTKITLKHSMVPPGQGESYKQGWEDYYFAPMRKYFSPKVRK